VDDTIVTQWRGDAIDASILVKIGTGFDALGSATVGEDNWQSVSWFG
jgi:hypothetical protein